MPKINHLEIQPAPVLQGSLTNHNRANFIVLLGVSNLSAHCWSE